MNCHYLIIYIFAFWIIVVVITGEKRLLSIPSILVTQNRNKFFMKITSKKISIEFYANHQQLTKNDEKETNKQKNKRNLDANGSEIVHEKSECELFQTSSPLLRLF